MKCQLHGIGTAPLDNWLRIQGRTSPDRDDVGPVDGGVVAYVGFDEFAGAIDVGDGE